MAKTKKKNSIEERDKIEEVKLKDEVTISNLEKNKERIKNVIILLIIITFLVVYSLLHPPVNKAVSTNQTINSNSSKTINVTQNKTDNLIVSKNFNEIKFLTNRNSFI